MADPAEQRRLLDRAQEVSEVGLDQLAQAAGERTRLEELEEPRLSRVLERSGLPPGPVARVYFWAAINWGAWSQKAGLLSAVRQGVANRVHDYAQLTIALEPELDGGGAFRLLGRMHAELPRVPFLSAWVDRDEAVPLLERAFALAPADPGNQLLLALTLLDLAPDRRDEAVALLKKVEGLTPRPAMQVEDWAMREGARDRLAALGEST